MAYLVESDVEKNPGAGSLAPERTATSDSKSDQRSNLLPYRLKQLAAGLQMKASEVDRESDDGDSLYSKTRRLIQDLHVEQRGIERVPEDQRAATSYYNIGSLWLAANMVIPSFTIGVLGNQLFGIGFIDGILVIFFFNLLATFALCCFSTLGPTFGLRQMVLTRLWCGWYGSKIFQFLNFLACLGWAAANIVVGAQLINTVNPNVPGFAGIIIIATCTLIITFFGYRVIHAYEYWSWIPNFIVFLIILGEFARSGDFVNIPMRVGKSELGAVLSFGATVFGFGTGYTSFAADYTVYEPPNRPKIKVFFATWVGIMFPILFTEMLGCAVITATAINGHDNIYQHSYTESGVGGLIGAVLFPRLGRFGQFCEIILALSIVANNCPNLYSVGLTLLTWGRWTRCIPRFGWTLVGTAIYVAVAIPGYSDFEAMLENFMNFIAYWLAMYQGIVFVDHFAFKRGLSGYHAEYYDNPEKLAVGLAAMFAFACGVGGMICGMSQAWFVGPIALRAGSPPNGGDVGFELGFAFAAVGYLIARPIELRILKR